MTPIEVILICLILLNVFQINAIHKRFDNLRDNSHRANMELQFVISRLMKVLDKR